MEQVLSSPFLSSRVEKYSRSELGQQLDSPPGRESRDQPAAPSVSPQQPPDRQVPPAVPHLNINQVGVAVEHSSTPFHSVVSLVFDSPVELSAGTLCVAALEA